MEAVDREALGHLVSGTTPELSRVGEFESPDGACRKVFLRHGRLQARWG
jgi:hypothetical protein